MGSKNKSIPVSRAIERRFQLALDVAQLSGCKGYHHGAVIYRGNRRLGMAVNTKDKTHPQSSNSWTQHAEFAAILGLGLQYLQDQGKTVLYSARRGPGGVPRMSRPCKSCMRWIREAGIDRVVYWDRKTEKIEIRRVKDME